MVLTGPDVSHHQGLVDWQQVAGAGHDFAFVKATEGAGFVDSQFRRNWTGIAQAGMTRGAYHFLRSGLTGAEQARHYLTVIGDPTGALCCLDVERGADGTEPGISHVRGFAAEFHRLAGTHPLVIYTGGWYWRDAIGNPKGNDLGVLWHSEYESSQREIDDGPEGDSYGGWSRATFWQYTSSGRCPGVTGNCDLNVFYGTLAELRALTGRPLLPAPEPDKENPDMLVVKNSRGHGLLLAGSAVYGLDNTSLEAIDKAGVPVAKVSDSVFSELNSRKA